MRLQINRSKCSGAATLVLALAALLSPAPLAAGKKQDGRGDTTQYDLVVLAPIAGVTWSSAADVDDAGNVVGHYEDDSGEHFAYRYDRAQDKSQTLVGGTTALGLNSRGEIVGGNQGLGLALYWKNPQADPDVLKGLTETGTAVAADINDAGIAIGQSFDDSVSSAVLWSVSAQGASDALELAPLPGDLHALARKVSEFDETGVALVVGYSGDDSLGYESGRAVMWALRIDANGNLQTTPAIDLGALGGETSTGDGVNRNGDTCGTTEYHVPFFKPAGQPMQALELPRKAVSGGASSLNDSAAVVGGVLFEARNGTADARAYIWLDGRATDLNSRVALGNSERLEAAAAISNQGHIAGMGFFPTVSEGTIAFLLVPR